MTERSNVNNRNTSKWACWMAGIVPDPFHSASLILTRSLQGEHIINPFCRIGNWDSGWVSESPSVTQLVGGRSRNFVCEEMGIVLMI